MEYKLTTKYNRDMIITKLQEPFADSLQERLIRLYDESVQEALKELGYLSPEYIKQNQVEITCPDCDGKGRQDCGICYDGRVKGKCTLVTCDRYFKCKTCNGSGKRKAVMMED
jgi:hypothetical protein